MRRLLFLVGLACAILLAPQPSRAQDSEVKKLKDKIKLLEEKIEDLKQQNEVLKKLNKLLEKGAGKKGVGGEANDTSDKPSETVEDIEYVLDKVTRTSKGVTLQLIATNSEEDTSVFITGLEAVDEEGNSYEIKRVSGRDYFVQVKVRKGIKAKINLTLPNIPARTTQLSLIEIKAKVGMLRGTKFSPGNIMKGTEVSKEKSIKFTNVRLPAKKKARK